MSIASIYLYPPNKANSKGLAAWLRIQVLTANLLTLMKAVALDEEYRDARPKRLRFAIFNHVGRMVSHARRSFIRLCTHVLEGLLKPGRRRLLLAARPAT